MKLASYFQQPFPMHLSQLQLRPANQVLRDLFHDPLLVIFGGRDWAHVQQDLAPIPRAQRAHCVYALLAIVLTDQCLQRYFRSAYPVWREATAYPKFGWTGFGLHAENPYKLLSVAESSGMVDPEALLALLPEFVEFFRELVSAHFSRELPTVDVQQFFQRLLDDGINLHRSGSVLPRFDGLARQAWCRPDALQAAGACQHASTVQWRWRTV